MEKENQDALKLRIAAIEDFLKKQSSDGNYILSTICTINGNTIISVNGKSPNARMKIEHLVHACKHITHLINEESQDFDKDLLTFVSLTIEKYLKEIRG